MSRKKREPASSPYFTTTDASTDQAQKRVRPELLQAPEPSLSSPVVAPPPIITPPRRSSPRRATLAEQKSPVPPAAAAAAAAPAPARTASDEVAVSEPVDFPQPVAPQARCTLHEAIMARETGIWRTTDMITASAPLIRHLRLRAVSETLCHRTYSMSFSQPDGSTVALAGGEGRISLLPAQSLASYNAPDNDKSTLSSSLQVSLSFVGTYRYPLGVESAHC